MLHKETVETGTLDLIKQLMADSRLSDFVMVGGTALSLQIGHRISIDIDLFTQKAFDSESLKQYIEDAYRMTNAKAITNGLFGFINDIKIDLIAHQYPLVQSMQEIESVRMLSLEDIGAMKIHAIVQNGSRYKDFVDMYFLLERQPLQVFINAYEKKYPDATIVLAKNGLTYFEDIDYTVPIKLIHHAIPKESVQKRLRDAVINLGKVYQTRANDQKQNKGLKQRRRGSRL
jgi:hypothetical protein